MRRESCRSPWDTRPIDVTPDWICEILLASNVGDDRVRERRLYAGHDVPFYVLRDPAARMLEALCLDLSTKPWIQTGFYDGDAVDRITPFEAVEFEVDRLFRPR